MMRLDDRIAKLRRMAEHPRSNPHEAAVARSLLERLEREYPSARATAAYRPGYEFDFDFDAWWEEEEKRRWARFEEINPALAAILRGQEAARKERLRWHDEERRLYHRPERPRAEVIAWTARLRPGDQVRTLHHLGIYGVYSDAPPLPSEILTVARRTPSGIVVMTDGSRWNGDGYKRGEGWRNGYRTYIVAAMGAVS